MKTVTLYKRGMGSTLLCKEFQPDRNGKLPKSEIDALRRLGWTKTKPMVDEATVRRVR